MICFSIPLNYINFLYLPNIMDPMTSFTSFQFPLRLGSVIKITTKKLDYEQLQLTLFVIYVWLLPCKYADPFKVRVYTSWISSGEMTSRVILKTSLVKNWQKYADLVEGPVAKTWEDVGNTFKVRTIESRLVAPWQDVGNLLEDFVDNSWWHLENKRSRVLP